MSCARADLLSIAPGGLSQEQLLAWQEGVNQRQNLQAPLVGFQNALGAKDGALIEHGADARIRPGKAGQDGGVIKRLFNCQVREVEPLQQQVDTLHSRRLQTQACR